jgi:hypothetical protein
MSSTRVSQYLKSVCRFLGNRTIAVRGEPLAPDRGAID